MITCEVSELTGLAEHIGMIAQGLKSLHDDVKDVKSGMQTLGDKVTAMNENCIKKEAEVDALKIDYESWKRYATGAFVSALLLVIGAFLAHMFR